MALKGLSTTVMADALKVWYRPAIEDQSKREHILLNRLSRHELTGGKEVYVALLRRGNPAVASRAEGSALPVARSSKFAKATFGMKSLYGNFDVTGQSIRASNKGDKSSFVAAVDHEMQQLIIELPREHNRMLFNDGSGALTACGTTSASTTVNVTSTQYILTDDQIDIRNTTSGAAVTTDKTVVSVPSSTTFTLAAAVTTSASHSVYKEGSRNEEIWGLEAICNTANPTAGNFGNIDRTAAGNEFWQGNILENPASSGTNRPLTRGLMQQAISKSPKRAKGKISLIVCDRDMWNTYGNLLAPGQRFQDSIKEIDGGFQALDFAGIPVVADDDCKPNMMFFLDERSLFFIERGDYEWRQEDGSILKDVAGKDAYTAQLVKDMQFVSDHPNRQVWLKDLAINLN